MRRITYAHSKSILDRREHCVSIGRDNTLVLHMDYDIEDALNRHTLVASPFSSEKWEVSGSGNIYTQNSTLVVNGDNILLVLKDILEIDTYQKWYISLSILNKNAPNAQFSFGTIDYIDLNTPITTGRPLGATYDNWCLYNQLVPIDNRWHTFSNTEILAYHYKSGCSSNPNDLHKWPSNTNYAKIFIKIDNLNGGEIVLKDLDFFFINDLNNTIDSTPSYNIIDPYGGKFGGAVELAGSSKNLIWNGNLKFGKKRWSIDPSGLGLAFSEIDNDGSYKLHFENIRNTKDIIRIDALQNIQASTKYTLSFYARSDKPISFRKIVIQDPSTEALGWKYPEIVYIDQVWKKIKLSNESFSSVPSGCNQLVISEPDNLENDTLLIYYNGILLCRGDDFNEYSNNELYLNFTPKDSDIIKIYTKSSSNQILKTDQITFNQDVNSGSNVTIKHIKNSFDDTEEIATEEIKNPEYPITSLIIDSYTSDTNNKMYVFRNGALLEENDDYYITTEWGKLKINFNYQIPSNNTIKIITFKNVLILRQNQTASAGQQTFSGLSYTDDGHHLIVFRNGVLVKKDDDYTETNSSSIHFNQPLSNGENISFITLSSPYEFEDDEWNLSSDQSVFNYNLENMNILRMVFVNGVLQSQNSSVQNDYITNFISQSSGFKYSRYDLTPLANNQTNVSLPFTYTPGNNEIWVYRNGLMQIVGEDYVESSSNSITLQTPAVFGELITVYKITYLPVGSVDSIIFTREEYNAQSGLAEYKVSQDYILGSNELSVFLNGMLLRKSIDYSETDTHTVTFNIPLQDKDKIVFLVGKKNAGATNVGFYYEDVYHGTDVSTGNILTTSRSLNFIQGVEGTVWIKDVKLEEGQIERSAYNSGITYSANMMYHLDEAVNKYEGTLSFYIEPYEAVLSSLFQFKGEVENFSQLPSNANVDDIYRTENDYIYWQWDGVSWDQIDMETLRLENSTWSLLKIERFFDVENRFKIIYGEPNDYGIISLPPLQGFNLISIVWNLYGVQWYQMEVPNVSDLPQLGEAEDGFVYRVLDPFSYYRWEWDSITSTGSWIAKAPMATYDNYSDLPSLSSKEDGFVARIIKKPKNFKGSVQNKSDLTPIANAYGAEQEGLIWEVISENSYYEWNWDHYGNNGKFRKIDISTYYQWIWDYKTASGNWEQCNTIRVYINGGKDGIFSKSFREVNDSPVKLRFFNTAYSKFDELRLDSIARDETEIEMWYKSQMPFYPIGQKAAIA